MLKTMNHSPASGSSRAEVLLVHGIGEHQGRYDDVVDHLNSWGFGCWRFDLRGHGTSPGPRGDAPKVDSLLEDVAAQMDAVRDQTPGQPLVLLGHSMGGLLCARVAAAALRGEGYGRSPDALVLSSPVLDMDLSRVQSVQVALARRLLPHVAVSNRLQPEWISRDPAVVQAYTSDPLVHDRVTPTLMATMVDGGPVVIRSAPEWRVPTLLLWAGADRCTNPRGSAAFAQAAPQDVVQGQCFAGLAHEIFNEPEKEQVFAVLRDWLDGRFPR